MNLNIAICDDDPEIISTLTKILWQFQIATDHNLKIDSFSNGNQLLEAYHAPGTYHILFLDVEMPERNGIETAMNIRNKQDYRVNIVFVSNYPEYMQSSFSVHPFHYLQKPITSEIITKVMNQIIAEIQKLFTPYTLIDISGTKTLININEIQYIQIANSKIKELNFHFPDQQITTRGLISNWAKQLEEHNFLLCRRDILLNLSAIHYFTDTHVILRTGECVPTSRNYRKRIQDLYLNRIIICNNI